MMPNNIDYYKIMTGPVVETTTEGEYTLGEVAEMGHGREWEGNVEGFIENLMDCDYEMSKLEEADDEAIHLTGEALGGECFTLVRVDDHRDMYWRVPVEKRVFPYVWCNTGAIDEKGQELIEIVLEAPTTNKRNLWEGGQYLSFINYHNEPKCYCERFSYRNGNPKFDKIVKMWRDRVLTADECLEFARDYMARKQEG